MKKTRDLYPNSSFTNDYKEHIIKQINKGTIDQNDKKNIDTNESMETEESKVKLELQKEIDTIKSLVNQVLENQERILDKLNDLNSAKIERKSSFVDRIFKND